jgi:Protein of unknown function with PCYCGC motif
MIRRPALRHLPATRLRLAPVLVLVLVMAPSTAACAGDHDAAGPVAAGSHAATMAPVTPAQPAEVPMGDQHRLAADEMAAAWDARPDYVRALPAEWQAAYAFALASPEVLQWLPCYCGCGGMGHRSNLDCFFQRREAQAEVVYEEHGSYCDICVDTANMAASMLREGKTMIQIRAAVDLAFGDRGPGTDTVLPPT